jgi:glutamine synthetase
MERNLYDLTADERARLGVGQLPETLGEAIEELADSALVRKALGEHIFTRYVDLKRAEWDDQAPSPRRFSSRPPGRNTCSRGVIAGR